MRRSAPSITASASATTAPSTQPPDTDPATSPSSLTAMAAPGRRGPDPSVSMTRAIATRLPAARHLSMSSRISFMAARSLRWWSRGQLLGELLERGQRVALDEAVDVGQRGGHPPCEGLVTGAGLERVDPHDAVGDAVQAGHLLTEDLVFAAVPPVGEDDDDGLAGGAPHAPLVVEPAQPVSQAGAAGPVGDGQGGAGQRGVGVAGRQLAGEPGEPGAEGEHLDAAPTDD